MKKDYLKQIIVTTVLVISVSCSLFFGFKYLKEKDGMRTAEQAVMLMYNFESFTELYDKQMAELKEIVTEDVYNNITVENIDRALTTYLKFRQNPAKVTILEKTEDHIIYTITSDSLTTGRKFVMYYDTNIFGKINKMEEAELRDFYKATSTVE